MPKENILDQLRQVFEDASVYAKRYTPADIGNTDQFVDFPYVEDPDPFKTHTSLEQDVSPDEENPDLPEPGPEPSPPDIDKITADLEKNVMEQDLPDKPISPPPEEAGSEAGGEMPEGMPGGEMPGGEMPGGEMGGMGDMGMGMGEPQQNLTSSEIGRVYELKKIYSRLSAVETYLARTTDESILELRKFVSQSIDLFEVVITNFEQFKDKIDVIIVMFYEFLSIVYGSLRKYFHSISNEKY